MIFFRSNEFLIVNVEVFFMLSYLLEMLQALKQAKEN